jgi:hypothetical protein
MSGARRASFAVTTMRSATSSSRFALRSGVVGKLRPSVEERNAEGQTTSRVRRFMSCDPKIPGMTMTGSLSLRARAGAKMRSRSGVRRAPQPALVIVITITRVMSDE